MRRAQALDLAYGRRKRRVCGQSPDVLATEPGPVGCLDRECRPWASVAHLRPSCSGPARSASVLASRWRARRQRPWRGRSVATPVTVTLTGSRRPRTAGSTSARSRSTLARAGPRRSRPRPASEHGCALQNACALAVVDVVPQAGRSFADDGIERRQGCGHRGGPGGRQPGGAALPACVPGDRARRQHGRTAVTRRRTGRRPRSLANRAPERRQHPSDATSGRSLAASGRSVRRRTAPTGRDASRSVLERQESGALAGTRRGGPH